MKDYKQFIKTLPNSTIVCALGEFNPPTTTHELLVKTVQVVSEQRKADHIIFTSPSDILQEEKKHQFLKLIFPKSKVVSLGESFFSATIKKLNEKYKRVVIIAGADQFDEFKQLKEYAWVEIISIGTKNPDVDAVKMKQFVTKGLYEEFKELLPSTIRDIDGKRLMNEMRIGMDLEPIKEQLNLVKDKLREDYFKGKIFNVGNIVESAGQQYEIVKRGSNHLLLKEQSGKLVSKWIQDVTQVKEAVIQQTGTDKIDPTAPESDTGAKQEMTPKGKTKGFLTFYNYKTGTSTEGSRSGNLNAVGSENTRTVREDKAPLDKSTPTAEEIAAKHNVPVEHIIKQIQIGSKIEHEHTKDQAAAEEIARDHLNEKPDYYKRLKKFVEGLEDACWKGYTAVGTKKKNGKTVPNCVPVKEEIVGAALVPDDENEEYLGIHHLRKQKVKHHLGEAKKKVCPDCGKHECECGEQRPGIGTENNAYTDPFFKEDVTEQEIDSWIQELTEEELLGLDEHDEWDLVYEDTEEVIPAHPEEEKLDLMEVLSRTERMKGKIRLRKTQAKRSRSTKINIRRFAPSAVINKRARRLAIKLIKKRMLRGRDPSKVSIGDKERIEKSIAKNKALVDRVAQKLVVRTRRVEKSRMSKGKSSKGSMPSVF